jgi:hypothetical protein
MTLTPENKAERNGRFTASNIHKLITPGHKAAANQTAENYIIEVAASRVTGWQREITSKQMRHGQENELAAMLEFERVSGLLVKHNTHIEKIGEWTGATPDAYIVDFDYICLATVDVKCPFSSYWLQKAQALDGIVPHEYFCQAQMQMMHTDLNKHYLVRYYTTGEYDEEGMEIELDLSDDLRIFWQVIERDQAFIDDVLIPVIAGAVVKAKEYVEKFTTKVQP